MTIIRVAHAGADYEVLVASIAELVPRLAGIANGCSLPLVSDATVYELYGGAFASMALDEPILIPAGETAKDPRFSATINRADALVIVAPEYNPGYPGLLKHALDTNLKEYIHKAVGICGVSAGAFGGARVIENLLPVMRELGLVTIFWDANFVQVQNAFDASGALADQSFIRRIDKFLKELIWMATVLRYGRERVPIG